MNTEIQDYRLQHWLQAKIATLPINQQMQLKNLRLCNHKTIPQVGVESAVFLLVNNRSEGKFFGQTTCKNTWACPCCTAKMMSKYSAEIGDALEALKAQGYFGFMITFTVPHLRFETCRDVTDRLYKTWNAVFKFSSKARSHGNQFTKFRQYFNIKHRIRVAEYTYGKNGWHPHFHAIFWAKREYKDEILAWQEKLNEFWCYHCRKVTEKFYDERTSDRINVYLENKEYPAVKISTDRDGKILESQSSDYLAGWGADKELTGNYRKKASHANHLTPYQILELAAEGNKKYQDLYIEFCLQVTKKPVHHRVDFSQSGLKKIISLYRQTNACESFILKKKVETAEWQVVCWFTKEQWSELCYLNKFSPILSNLLWLAVNARELIAQFLESFDIYLEHRRHRHADHIENIFNNVA